MIDEVAITSRIKQLSADGLSLRAIATKLLEEGGPKLDPKTIGARLKEPVDGQLEHISPDLRPLAMACADLRFDPRNPNSHPDPQKAALQASLKTFGQMKAIVANTREKGKPVVIAGNATLEAALALGWTHIAVNRVNVSDSVAKAYTAADKRTADMSEWDPNVLASILVELEEEQFDMASLGFDDAFVKQAIEAAQQGQESDESGDGNGSSDGDDTPVNRADELQKEWQTERGQVWEIPSKSVPGMFHRVVCGDSLDPAVVAIALDGRKPDGVWSDAPYGISIVASNGTVGSNSKKYTQVAGDDSVDVAQGSFTQIYRAYTKAVHIWWGANHYSSCLPSSSCWIVWDKQNDGMAFADAELAWCSDRGAVRVFRHMWSGAVRASEREESRIHPTQKPIALFEWCAQKYLPGEGKVWLDPFAGSGISLLGAERLGQIACCIELSEAYVAVILERARAAGLEPRLVQS